MIQNKLVQSLIIPPVDEPGRFSLVKGTNLFEQAQKSLAAVDSMSKRIVDGGCSEGVGVDRNTGVVIPPVTVLLQHPDLIKRGS